jgi:hypothetical protein
VETVGAWTVRRRWSDPAHDGVVARFRKRFGRVRNPIPKRWRRKELSPTEDAAAELAGGCLDAELGLIILAFVIVVLLAVFLWELVVFSIVAALGELLLIVLVVVAGVIARVVLRHPWTVHARHIDGREVEWHIRGFRRSKRFAAFAEERLRAGWPPEQIDESQLAME